MNITYQDSYNGYKINTNFDKGYGCITEILDKHIEHLEDMLSKHSKVFQKRLDIRFPDGMDNDKILSELPKFTNRLTQDIKRNNKLPSEDSIRSAGNNCPHDTDPRIIMVKEQNTSDKMHIHVTIYTNGNAKNNDYDLEKRTERQLKNAYKLDDVTGLVDYCNHRRSSNVNEMNGHPSSIMIDQNSPDYERQINEAVCQISYPSKIAGKERLPKGSWAVTGTRLPKSTKKDNSED